MFRNHMTAEGLPGLAEQRVSVLFADIADSTGLAERLGPKRFGEILSRYYQDMSDIIFEHGGMVDKYLGDGIMAVFGMTGDKEAHEERAVRAGLQILEHIEQMNAEMSEELFIGVGVNTGPVVAGYVGTKQRVELTVLGDTVNVAAGLQHNARPNRLWIGPATMAGIVGLFETQRVGSIRVKGRTVTIQAHEVIRHPTGSGMLPALTPE
jgi:adenylate cyclase